VRFSFLGVLALTACGSGDFVADHVSTVVTESNGVGFDELGRGVVGAGDDGLCVFAAELGMVGEMDVPGQDRVLDMWGAQAVVAGDAGHLAFPDQHGLSDLNLADQGTPVAAVITRLGVLAAVQHQGTCVLSSQREILAEVPGTCQDLAADRDTGQSFLLVDNTVYQVADQAAVPLDVTGEHIAWDGINSDLWVAEGTTLTRISVDIDDSETFDLGDQVLDIEPAGQAWDGVIAALFRARSSVVHVRPDGSIGTEITPERPATGVTTNHEGTFVGVEGQTQVELYQLVRPGERRRQTRQRLATGGGGPTVMYD